MFLGSTLATDEWGAGNACHAVTPQLIRQPSLADFNEVSTQQGPRAPSGYYN